MNRMFLTVAAVAITATGCNPAEPEVATEAEEAARAVEAVVENAASNSAGLCLDAGPQTPRDISSALGLNTVEFEIAPPATELNLCNIHTHTNAEHKGPGFNRFVNNTESGGYACNETDDLSEAELAPLNGAFQGAVPGDTIEVHWVHTSCPIAPGEGLGSCLSETCADPLLRVEAQTFLVVNDPGAADFMD